MSEVLEHDEEYPLLEAIEDTSQFGLGRLPQPFDSRDALHTMPMLLARVSEDQPEYRYWTTGPVLNQGDSPHCVGFAWTGWLMCSPLRQSTAYDGDAGGHALYAACKAIDGIPGVDGTYVRAGAKVEDGRGLVQRYVWATSLSDLIDWVLRVGPVVVGTPWLQGMFSPSADGRLDVSGDEAGGHAYLVVGYNRERREFRLMNSWGDGWGQRGRAWIDADALWGLISQGEACAAVEQRVAS